MASPPIHIRSKFQRQVTVSTQSPEEPAVGMEVPGWADRNLSGGFVFEPPHVGEGEENRRVAASPTPARDAHAESIERTKQFASFREQRSAMLDQFMAKLDSAWKRELNED